LSGSASFSSSPSLVLIIDEMHPRGQRSVADVRASVLPEAGA
jgi:hypothetical protein